MTSPKWTPSQMTARVMAVAFVCVTFVTVVVNVLIYTARWKFAAFFPERAAERPVTISESIADPRIGEPFADWMLMSAPILFVGVALLILSTLGELRRSGAAAPNIRRRITVLSWGLVLLQLMACVGMVILSQYRFPHFRDAHMGGSYLFFFSQAFVVVCGEMLSRSYARLGPDGRVWSPRFARWRRGYVWVPILLGVGYLALFLGKGYAPDEMRHAVYYIYVSTEVVLLSSFLFYMMTYAPDMLATARHLRRGRQDVALS